MFLIVGAAANSLEVSIAVCVGFLGFHGSDKAIAWLVRCRVDLGKHYDRVTKSPPKLSCLYPNPTPVEFAQAVYKQLELV